MQIGKENELKVEVMVNLFGELERYSEYERVRDFVINVSEGISLKDIVSYFDLPLEETKIFLVNGINQDLE
jgi:predicted HTH domain antitoxin